MMIKVILAWEGIYARPEGVSETAKPPVRGAAAIIVWYSIV